MIRNIDEAYEMMEYYLSDTLYLADDVMTVADVSAITTISSLNGLHPIDEKRFVELNVHYILTIFFVFLNIAV